MFRDVPREIVTIIVAAAFMLGVILGTGTARAQSWTETVSYTDGQGNTRYCTITYVNGGRQRYVVCN